MAGNNMVEHLSEAHTRTLCPLLSIFMPIHHLSAVVTAFVCLYHAERILSAIAKFIVYLFGEEAGRAEIGEGRGRGKSGKGRGGNGNARK